MEIPYNLIIKFLQDQCSVDEISTLVEWRQSAPENEVVYADIARTFCRLEGVQEALSPNKEKVWAKISEQIYTPSSEQSSLRVKKYFTEHKRALLAFAAACLLVLCTSVFILTSKNPVNSNYAVFETQKESRSFMKLPDGSKVWLNAESKITYSDNFNKGNRDVTLVGEAFFEVQKNKKLPFRVFSNQINVRVTGTKFNVCAYPYDSFISVFLQEGSVNVLTNTEDKLLAALQPNQKIEINKQDLQYAISDIDASRDDLWVNGKLLIEGLTAESMFDKISKRYDVNISTSHTPETTRYWITIKDESLIETLQVINKITPINYSINGKEVIIQYKQRKTQ